MRQCRVRLSNKKEAFHSILGTGGQIRQRGVEHPGGAAVLAPAQCEATGVRRREGVLVEMGKDV
jgi:hypothetical protein